MFITLHGLWKLFLKIHSLFLTFETSIRRQEENSYQSPALDEWQNCRAIWRAGFKQSLSGHAAVLKKIKYSIHSQTVSAVYIIWSLKQHNVNKGPIHFILVYWNISQFPHEHKGSVVVYKFWDILHIALICRNANEHQIIQSNQWHLVDSQAIRIAFN